MAQSLIGFLLVERAAAILVKVLEAALHAHQKAVQGLKLPKINRARPIGIMNPARPQQSASGSGFAGQSKAALAVEPVSFSICSAEQGQGFKRT